MNALEENKEVETCLFWGSSNIVLKLPTHNFLEIKPSKAIINDFKDKIKDKKFAVGVIDETIVDNLNRIANSDVSLAKELFEGIMNDNKTNTDQFMENLEKKNGL